MFQCSYRKARLQTCPGILLILKDLTGMLSGLFCFEMRYVRQHLTKLKVPIDCIFAGCALQYR